MTREEMLQDATTKQLDDKTGSATEHDKQLAATLQFFALKLQQLGCKDVVMFASSGERCIQVVMSRERFMMDTAIETFRGLSFQGKMITSLKMMDAMKEGEEE